VQLRQRAGDLQTLNVEILVVTFEDAASARRYLGDTDLPWPLVLDEDRRLYRAYGMERGRWWQIYGPRTLFTYLRLLLGGRRLAAPGGDPDQLGGDILVDPDGRIRLQYVSDNPADRPPVEQIVSLIRSGAGR